MTAPPNDGTTVIAKSVGSEEPAAFILRVVEGPDVGKTFAVDGERACRALVGQSVACEHQVGDRLVSRRHFALEPAGQRLRIADLSSTNGTFVDGVSIVEAYLRGGEVVRAGATAFVVERALEKSDRARPLEVARARFGRLVGASDAMRRLHPLCDRLAQSNVTVVIEGETGTGKEVLAEALHEEGPRSAKPFVVFDCTAVAPGVIESALFGHEKGAFTGAAQTHLGVFEEAEGGTLLIDEIGDLELSLQAKLLRVLQRGEVRRVGGSRNIPIDVRVVAATRRDLDREVAAGRFRDDLFFRLAVARIELPPLRRREGDIPLLSEHFWKSLGGGPEGIPFETMRRLDDYAWPGNVRELFNAIARLIALGPLAPVEIPRPKDGYPTNEFLDSVLDLDLPLAPARQRVVDEFERRYVARVVERHDGNIGKAAAAAGIARRYFQLLRAKAKTP